MLTKITTPSRFHGKTALITGASSGIGAATARKLAQGGLTVVLVARREERLSQLADEIRSSGGSARVIAADLSLMTDRSLVHEQVIRELGGIDVLVNNAGLGWYGYFDEMPWEVASQVLDVNITAVAHLTNLFLPHMRNRGQGHIINVGSIAGSFPNQGTALYSASKSFLDAFTTVLHRELRGSNVHCSVVRAGPVSTEFFDQARRLPNGFPIPAERFGVTADHIADRIWGLLLRPRRAIYVPGVLAVVPWVEILFGRIIDQLGPLLLRRASA